MQSLPVRDIKVEERIAEKAGKMRAVGTSLQAIAVALNVDSTTVHEAPRLFDMGVTRPEQVTPSSLAELAWLTARGTVDVTNPPIAGLGGVSSSDGLTEQYLYDNNLNDGVGLDSSGGVARLIGSGNISLSAAISKLAAAQTSGGAGISFTADAPGSARVSINGALHDATDTSNVGVQALAA